MKMTRDESIVQYISSDNYVCCNKCDYKKLKYISHKILLSIGHHVVHALLFNVVHQSHFGMHA